MSSVELGVGRSRLEQSLDQSSGSLLVRSLFPTQTRAAEGKASRTWALPKFRAYFEGVELCPWETEKLCKDGEKCVIIW